MAVDDGGAEGGEVGVAKVGLGDAGVESVAVGLGPAVHRVVLRRGDGLEIAGIVALHPRDERDAHRARQRRVLAVGFLAAAPARVAEDVDVGRPERKALVDVVLLPRAPAVVHRAGLVRDGRGRPVYQVGVPGGGEADGLREGRGPAGTRHAVERLVPPGERGNPQPLDRARALDHQRGLLVERQAPDEVVHALVDRQVRVPEGERLGRRRGRPLACDGGRQRENDGRRHRRRA